MTGIARDSGAADVTTVFPFTLPVGYRDGTHDGYQRDGQMRLATAADEILPLRDPRVQANPAYLSVIVLSRVVTRLGTVEPVTPKVIEGLFATDFSYLQELYNTVNGTGSVLVPTTCPRCELEFETVLEASGKPSPTPPTVSSTR